MSEVTRGLLRSVYACGCVRWYPDPPPAFCETCDAILTNNAEIEASRKAIKEGKK